jgi:hypothetical protein
MKRAFHPVGLLALAALVLSLASGCEDDETIMVPDQVVTVSITASSETVTSGGTVELIAVVTSSAGEPVTVTWSASEGSFSSATDDTTQWTAPEAADLYDISVIATDGQHVGIGTKVIGVDTYVPSVAPFYRGASTCQGCHGDLHTTWTNTPHATAWETLDEIGQGGNAVCIECHTVGYRVVNADPALDNGGYDETAVARLHGVQCENCHGPGSEHPSPEFTSVEVVKSAAMCGDCHNGPHHPTYDEWSGSPHATVIEFPASRTDCVKCHNGAYAGDYLDDPAAFQDPAAVTDTLPTTCAVCHDPHDHTNPGQLRNASVTDVVLPDGTVVPEAGAGRLCMSCHNGRRSSEDIEEQLNEGSDHFGPHHSCQGDMLAGTGAYELVAPDFPFTSSRHLAVRDGCVHCHTHAHEGEETYTGHGFLPTVEACQECHGVLTSFEQILAKEDFDGNMQIEGVQLEIDGLLTILEQAIIDASDTPEHRDALIADFEGAVGDTLISTREQREAAYNYFFVDFDSSRGVHNTTYAIQLLQQSTLAISPGMLPRGAYILRD